jgi:hypothetical protein
MSWTSGGPDWWQASNRKWYPPEQRPASDLPPPPAGEPGPMPPPPVGGSPYYQSSQYQAPKTSGTAIASFVLSLVWIFGLGSIVGIVLARSARREIATSNGRITGDGFAIAGMVLGILGVISGAFLIFSTIFAVHQLNDIARSGGGPFLTTTTVPYSTLRMGQSSIPVSGLGGGTITVYSVHPVLVGADPAMRTAPPGDELVAVHVKACAGAEAVPDPVVAWTGLMLTTNNDLNFVNEFPPEQYVQQPIFDPPSITALRPHQCIIGYQGFAVTAGALFVSVDWHTTNYEWRWIVPN